jgi:small subunit ribosomal protein S16
MLRIRLSRTGSKKQPSYRVVVTDIESKRDGRIVERIGHYNPRREPMEYVIDEDRALYWLSVGAQPSDPVRRLLDKQGTFDRLARMRKGESREALVGEFTGVDVMVAPVAEVPVVAATEADLVAEVEAIVATEEEE